jgi:hypothetical protein
MMGKRQDDSRQDLFQESVWLKNFLSCCHILELLFSINQSIYSQFEDMSQNDICQDFHFYSFL